MHADVALLSIGEIVLLCNKCVYRTLWIYRNIVSKEGTLRACELDAQMACKFAGFEPEYRNFKIKKNEANDECLRGKVFSEKCFVFPYLLA